MLLCVLVVHGQNKHERYIQQLPGTRLQFSMEAIPGGEFMMGSKGDAPADEKPAHRTQISPFWMSTFEVTWDLFEPFVYKDFEVANATEEKIDPKVDAVTRPTKPYLDMTFGMGKQGHPALAMTHYNAIQFCKWLYMRTGEFYRLPTEAEWEYACRAGSVSDYHFGDDATNLEDYGWYSENSDGETSAVGKKKPNAWGLFDMLGNVAEWTYDQYQEDYYQQFDSQIAENPISEPTALYPHSVRGGSFESKANELRSAARMASDPIWKQLDPQIPKSNWWFPEAPFVGMRLVRPVLKPSHEQIMAYYDKAPIKDF
ncbi:formylglycine-generating enzyme family protein [Sphingobacterium corticis]|uniref:Formylglycine-generating enzyme family protein n=1 Tax=Sphingobacterium corticis TaxID=1812823 RepID=A0ABW5NJU0_9SPHI